MVKLIINLLLLFLTSLEFYLLFSTLCDHVRSVGSLSKYTFEPRACTERPAAACEPSGGEEEEEEGQAVEQL